MMPSFVCVPSRRLALVVLALGAVVGCNRPGSDEQTSDDVERITSALTSGAVQINCGDNGAIPPFIADTDFSGGAGKTRNNVIDLTGVVNPAPMAVYQSQHYASPFTYTLPGFTPGSSQLIRLHFAETNPSNNAPNRRKFSVAINGTTQISNLDLFATVGMNKAYIQQFILPANSSGQYVLSFTASLDSATISGIEVGPPSSTAVGTWTSPNNPAPAALSVWAQLQLLTDGSVLVGDGQTSHWFKLTPDAHGSYATGTWSQAASSNFARGFPPSTMLKNGKYLVEGGEYVLGTDKASVDIYDPVLDTWTAAPSLSHPIGDTAASILPDGRFYSTSFTDTTTWILNPYVSPMTWTQSATLTLGGSGDEQGFALMQNGKILDVWNTGGSVFDITANGGLGAWTATGAIPVQLVSSDTQSVEIGPASLLYSGKVLQFGSAAHTDPVTGNEVADPASAATYDPTTNTWATSASSPDGLTWGDTSANVMINGHVLNTTAVATTSQGGNRAIWEYNPFGSSLGTFAKVETKAADPTAPNALVNPAISFPVFLQLPTGEVLVVDGFDVASHGNSNIRLYMPAGGQSSASDSWRPTLTSLSAPSGGDFTLTGKQLNGLTTGTSFGDDRNSASNYPIAWLKDTAGNVFYARTHDFDQMTPRPATTGSCKLTLPTAVPNGSYQLWVSANGVASSSSLPLTISGNHVASFSGSSVGPGATATWTVKLAAAASGATVVNLATDNASVATLGATSVTVPSGQTTATVTVTGRGLGFAHLSALTAVANAQFAAATGTFGWSVDTLFDETSFRSDGGPSGPSALSSTKTQVTWDVNILPAAPSGGVTVTLSSTDPSTFVVPATVTVPAGATKASFTVSKGSGSGPSATIMASLLNSSKTNTIKYAP